MWSDGGSDSGHLQAARFRDQDSKSGIPRQFHRAIAAPGMEQFAQNTAPHPDSSGQNPRQNPQPQRSSWRDFPPVVATLPEPLSGAGELH